MTHKEESYFQSLFLITSVAWIGDQSEGWRRLRYRLQPRQLVLRWRIKRILRIWIRLWPILLRACVDRLIGIGRVTSTRRGMTTSRRSVFATCSC